MAIETEYLLLRESKHPALLLPDSKPVQDAVLLIQQGKFSTSARMNRFLTNINKIPITIKHLSSKFKLNEIADHQSRNPAQCSATNCSIHRFINGLTESVVDAAAKCASLSQAQGVELLLPEDHQGVDALLPGAPVPKLASQVPADLDNSMTNRQAWKAAQNQSDSCKVAISHLQSGKVPSNKKRDLHNQIRHYVRNSILAQY